MKLEELKAYELLEKREINDIGSVAYRLRHKKTGAKLALLSNDDNNKVFYIGFRTPPADSTGVAHITEHSVLCGSKEFPLKDPFVELCKGSLNTFLNAMTYPDKTVYPVASCNDKDFQNLIHVYLDAVFYPNTYENESIFRQEGWHYEFDDEDNLFINGVVYNEMKGAFSSPDDILAHEVMNSLYPDNSYGVESGGDPDFIPDLTYEDFLDFHKKYYHPANSYIYLYGDMDMAEKLDYIDREYLSKFDSLDIDSTIMEQKSFNEMKRVVKECPLNEGEDADENTFMSLNFTMGKSVDRKLYLTMQILDHVLCSVPGAPIKKALVEKGIANDVYSVCENGIMQPYFSIVAKDTQLSKEKEFVDTVYQVINEIVDKGFDKKSLLGGINYFEFQYREADFGNYPKGLMYGLQALDSWLYDDDAPFVHIEAIETINFLKESVESGYFEEFLKKYILENNHCSIVLLQPTIGLQEKKDQQLKDRLSKLQASLSEADIKELKEKGKLLLEFQEREDSPEDLAKLPLLSREDLKKEAEDFKNELIESQGVKLLLHDYNTQGIGYLSLLFSMKDLPGELYPYTSLLKVILGQIDTDKYNYTDLNNELLLSSGGFNVTSTTFTDSKNDENFEFVLEVKTKYLYEKLPDVFELLKEIMLHSHLDDTDRIYEILAETKSQIQSSFMSRGDTVAVGVAMAGLKSSLRIANMTQGLEYYRFLTDILDNYESKKQEVVKKLRETLISLIRPENLLVDLTAQKGNEVPVIEQVKALLPELFSCDVVKEQYRPELLKDNTGLMTAGQVLYVCRAGNFGDKGLKYTGALSVLKVIMGYQYLWVNVRVKGGAYGCFSSFSRSGMCFFVSYRDPNLSKTIKIFEDAPKEIADFELDERTMTQFIIGTVSEMDHPKNPSAKGTRSLLAYKTNISFEDIQRERDEVLNATPEDIRALSKHLEAFLSDNRMVTVGNTTKIKEEEYLFDKVENLF